MHILPQGTRLPTIEEYTSLLMPFAYPQDEVKVSNIGAVTESTDNWNVVSFREGHEEYWALIPGPEFSPRLYRGQNRRYPKTLASVFRLNDEIEFIIKMSRLLEFAFFLMNHPGVLYIEGLEIGGLRTEVDWKCLGQHYGFPTDYLDTTRDRRVAEFFARCRPCGDDPVDGWEAVSEDEFDGVLYAVDLALLLRGNSKPVIFPAGPAPLLRPYRQKAVVLRLGENNFTELESVHSEALDYDASRAQELLSEFDGGRKLFPKDVFHTFFRRIHGEETVSIHALRQAKRVTRWKSTLAELVRVLQEKGYRVSDREPAASAEDIHTAQVEWESIREEYMGHVKVRVVSEPHIPGLKQK